MSELTKKEKDTDIATVEQTRGGATYVPRFDIVETDDGLILFGDLPGVATDNLDVRFENEHLTIFGKVEPRHREHEYLCGEYGVGDYYREFHVSEVIDPENISAELKDGVLTVQLPKKEAVKPKRITVKSA
jgi:HSP20 family protein